MEKENQRIAITKRLLKEALIGLLREKPIEKISITELCQAAGVNRATFYRHYSVPRDLLREIEGDILVQAEKSAPLPASADNVKPFLEALFSHLYRNAGIIRVLIRSNTEEDIVQLLYAANQAVLRVSLGEEQAALMDEPRLRLLSAYLSGGGYHMLRAWLLEEMPIPPQEVAQLFYDAVSRDLEAYVRRS